jgi:hypothetical protein
MFMLLTTGIFCGMIGLVVYELAQETAGSRKKLTDRYHE